MIRFDFISFIPYTIQYFGIRYRNRYRSRYRSNRSRYSSRYRSNRSCLTQEAFHTEVTGLTQKHIHVGAKASLYRSSGGLK